MEESCEDLAVTASDGEDAVVVNDDSGENSDKEKSRKRTKQPIMEGRQWNVRLQMMGLCLIKMEGYERCSSNKCEGEVHIG